jgi:hypothetical protein
VAVLPFTNMSADPKQEFFADGIAEDIITALSRYPSLFVIARNSCFTYKGRAVDVKQVGRELGVRYESDLGDWHRHGEDDVAVRHRQQLGLSVGQPLSTRQSLTLRAVPVAAGIVQDRPAAAARGARRERARGGSSGWRRPRRARPIARALCPR